VIKELIYLVGPSKWIIAIKTWKVKTHGACINVSVIMIKIMVSLLWNMDVSFVPITALVEVLISPFFMWRFKRQMIATVVSWWWW
jgi:hypothetical protein